MTEVIMGMSENLARQMARRVDGQEGRWAAFHGAVGDLLETLMEPSPEMLRAMETIEAEFGRPADRKAIYQAAIYQCLQPGRRAGH